jgi:hypothetical protein
MKTPAQQLRRLKRRKPGVYVYRTWRHLQPTRSEWGYVGKARDLDVRDRCHYGACHHKGCTAKDWIDLVKWRRTIPLPWWLGFDWITLSLETLVIAALRPRYNWQKNPRRDKVGPQGQQLQRLERDARPTGYRVKVGLVRAGSLALRVIGVLVIVTGLTGWWITK